VLRPVRATPCLIRFDLEAITAKKDCVCSTTSTSRGSCCVYCTEPGAVIMSETLVQFPASYDTCSEPQMSSYLSFYC